LCKDTVKVKPVLIDTSEWRTPHSLETLSYSFQFEFNKSIIVCVLYRTTHTANDVYNIELLFSQLTLMKKTFYVVGDFNLNLLFPDNYAKKLLAIINKYSLTQLITLPTRGNNLLDLMITNSNVCLNTEVLDPLLYQSDHLLTLCHIPFVREKSKTRTVSFRNYRSIDIELLNQVATDTFR